MKSIEERAALYGWTVQQVLDSDARIKAEVATWPPLTENQKAVIRTMFASRPSVAVEAPALNRKRCRRVDIPGEASVDIEAQEEAGLRVDAVRALMRTRVPQPEAQPRAVYLIGGRPDGPVKIGISHDPQRRARTLGTMSAVPARLLWSTLGGHDLESALHKHFDEIRMHGEWFDFTGRDAVAEVAAAADYFHERLADDEES